ncbi:MAG: paraquat-inducible protein A [Epsilonproteobacteria bacterium]|nr:paraquat-inducible protein A [Campylobacterota bacterium]
MKRVILSLIGILITVAIIFTSYKIYTYAKEYEKATKNYYEYKSDIMNVLKLRFEKIINSLGMGVIKIKDQDRAKLEKLRLKRAAIKDEIDKYLYYYLGAITLLILFFIFKDLQLYTIFLSLNGIVLLTFGILTPILLIVIYKNIEHIGDIVLTFQSKSIIGTISNLYKNNNKPIALIILIFSVIIPYLKSITILTLALIKDCKWAKKGVAFFKHLGKWSMIDVFVVSLLLVFMSMQGGENSKSEIEAGLYLFLGYIFLSLISSISIEYLLKNNSYSSSSS